MSSLSTIIKIYSYHQNLQGIPDGRVALKFVQRIKIIQLDGVNFIRKGFSINIIATNFRKQLQQNIKHFQKIKII